MVFGKFARKHLAVGAWKNPWKIVELTQVSARIRVLLQDKLLTRGEWAELYLPVGEDTPGAVACTCVKETSRAADRECLTCFGASYAPGYLKFMHQTLFWCSAEDSSFTLTNCVASTAKKANLIGITTGQTTATIVTQDKAFTNPTDIDWSLELITYRRTTGGTFTLEYSTDAGTTYFPVTLTEVTGVNAVGFTGSIDGQELSSSGSIRFRITMTRLLAGDLSPFFEILRLRRITRENESKVFYRPRKQDFRPGHILILKPWMQEQGSLEAGRGQLVDHTGDRTWTAPLDFFDTSLTHDTPSCRVDDQLGAHAFYKYTGGVQEGTRYVLTKTYISEKLGHFTHQFFDDRRAQKHELPYSYVW